MKQTEAARPTPEVPAPTDSTTNGGPTTGIARSRTRAILAGAAALALAASACGSDDDTDTTPADTTAADTAPADTSAESTIVPQPTPSSDLFEGDGEPVGTAVTAMDTLNDALNVTLADENVESFSTLVSIVGLDEITDADEVTVFAPSDEAIDALPEDDFVEIVEDPLLVRDVLEAHIVEGAVRSADLEDGAEVTTLSGGSLTVSIDGDTVMIGDATVTAADFDFDGGVVHVVDSVLEPAPL